jgi:4-alpha-glucanotransferase
VKRPALRALAERLGIISEYVDQEHTVVRTSDATREALLRVMGFDARTEATARTWLAELDEGERKDVVPPVRVVERDAASAKRVRVQLPPGAARARVRVTVIEEGGTQWRAEGDIRRAGTVTLPSALPYGYHRLEVDAGHDVREQSLIVVPRHCVTASQRLGRRKVMGIVANLYSQRREHDWGIGDLATLGALVDWGAQRGAAFVGINPLHALFNRGIDISPYSPVSRLFRNPIYIDVEGVPELAHSAEARDILNTTAARRALRSLREAPLLDYDGVIALKERVLAALHRTFRTRGGTRTGEYEAFVQARDPELTRFATWMTLATESGIPDWRQWPAQLRSPESPAVTAMTGAQRERVDFHRWLQFETHRQLGDVAQRARALGMPIGVYQDLAIGTNPGGSDTWTFPELFLDGASVGAPPDPLGPKGQNWGLPPVNPRALRAQRYRYWIQLLRRAFEHAGALRIDHVMGLFRMFWIPAGGTGKDGAYVRFDSAEMLGILALESVRHDALVVGEDLGTVPAEVAPALRKWGLLSSKVLYFERDGSEFKRASKYPAQSLATANTHDLATLAGFWTERDIALRARLGILRTAAELRKARRERAVDKAALLSRLRLAPPKHYEEPHFPQKLTASVHEFLGSTPASLVGESLDDLTGEIEPVNVPGVSPATYPSWRRRSRMTVEEIAWSFSVDEAMQCEDRRGRK